MNSIFPQDQIVSLFQVFFIWFESEKIKPNCFILQQLKTKKNQIKFEKIWEIQRENKSFCRSCFHRRLQFDKPESTNAGRTGQKTSCSQAGRVQIVVYVCHRWKS